MTFTSSVVSGHGRGEFLGYPTLNLVIPSDFDYQYGIYAGYVWLDKKRFLGAFHYGPVPSFDQAEVSLEVFVLDTSIQQNPSQVTFELVTYLREIIKYSTQQDLIDQITKDVQKTRFLLDKK